MFTLDLLPRITAIREVNMTAAKTIMPTTKVPAVICLPPLLASFAYSQLKEKGTSYRHKI